MKKLLTIGLSFILVVSLQAQSTYLSNLYFGVNGSGNISSVFPEHNYGSTDYYDHELTLGYSGGITIGATINDVHSFQLDINYSQQGQNLQDADLSNQSILKKRVDLKYLKAPLTYRYTRYLDAYSASSPSVYAEAGLYLAQLQNGSVTYTWADSTVSLTEATSPGNTRLVVEPTETKDLFSPFDAGLVIGLGVEIPLASDLSLTIGTRSEIGFTDLNAINYRFPSITKGYRPSLNIVTGVKVGLVYNLYM